MHCDDLNDKRTHNNYNCINEYTVKRIFNEYTIIISSAYPSSNGCISCVTRI